MFDPYDFDSLLAFHKAQFGDSRMEADPEPDPEPEPEPFDEARAKAKITKANSEAAALRKRLKDAEDKLAEAENAGKSDTQKLVDAASTAEKRAEAAEMRAMRLEVAHDKGLTPAQAKRLVGSSLEELEADADDLLEHFGSKPVEESKPNPSPKPRENLRGGNDPEQEPEETDPAKLAARIRRY